MEDFVASKSSAVEPYKPDEQNQPGQSANKKRSKPQPQPKSGPELPDVEPESGDEHKLDERV